MKTRLNVEVSFFENVTSKKPTVANLYNLLTDGQFAREVETVRNETDPKKRKELKLTLPLFTPSGLFSASDDSSIISHTGLICIDIDRQDNMDVDNFSELKSLIAKVPYVVYCGRSVRGEGFFCIIPIKHPDRHKQHFRSLQMDFARCGVIIDKSGSNVGRKRFVSHDPEHYHNPDAVVYDRFIAETPTPSTAPKAGRPTFKSSHITPVIIDELIAAIEETQIDITAGYNDWFAIGCSFANYFGEEGRARFHTISQFYPGYSPKQTDEKFDDALQGSYNYNIGTFIYYAHEAGVTAFADFRDMPEELN